MAKALEREAASNIAIAWMASLKQQEHVRRLLLEGLEPLTASRHCAAWSVCVVLSAQSLLRHLGL